MPNATSERSFRAEYSCLESRSEIVRLGITPLRLHFNYDRGTTFPFTGNLLLDLNRL